jgi:hypothetical protein
MAGNELRSSFAGEIGASRRFEIADPEHADAALKVFKSVTNRRTVRGDRAAKGGIQVQLVNRGGEILWETTKRVTSATTSGSTRQVASEVFNELLQHIRKLENLRK